LRKGLLPEFQEFVYVNLLRTETSGTPLMGILSGLAPLFVHRIYEYKIALLMAIKFADARGLVILGSSDLYVARQFT
jgi:hypothetical protein